MASIDDDSCDYSNAAAHDGWGWCAVTRNSCQPSESEVVDNCDCSDLAIVDGWDWNCVAGQSCAPLTSENATATNTG